MNTTIPSDKTVRKPFPISFIDYYFIACLLFAVFIGSIAFTGMKANQLLKWKDMELLEARQMQQQLERQYHQALSELEILRAEYEEVQALREKQKSQILQTLVQQKNP